MSFFVRADYGATGNFEVVTGNPADGYSGLLHRWRDNDARGFPWNFSGTFFRRRLTVRKTALIQEQPSRRLHVAAIVTSAAGTFLGLFIRDNNPTWAWQEPLRLPRSETFAYSGNPVLAQHGDFLEVYAPVATGGWARWQRNASGWNFIGIFQTALGRIDALAFTITRQRTFEMLIRRGSTLSHTARHFAAGESAWSAPRTLFLSARGAPSIIQSRFGRIGNLEVVTANANGGLTGLWADNDVPDAPRWSAPFEIAPRFGDAGDAPSDDDEVALVQSTFGTTGNFELLARRNGRTDFFWRIDAPPWTWSGPFRIASDPPDAGALLRRTDTLERRLAGLQDLRNSIVWTTGSGERRPYDAWTRAQKDRLNELHARIAADAPDLGLRCPDPRRNLSLSAPSGFPVLFFTADEAFDTYAAHVAHVLHLEITRAVPWSILDLPALELAELLWSDRHHSRIVPGSGPAGPYYPAHIVPGRDFQQPPYMLTDVTGVECDPRVSWRFMRGIRSTARRDKLGRTEEETLANLTYWFARNVGHGGPPFDHIMESWLRRAYLQDRLRAERRDFGFTVLTLAWASYGCHSAAALIHDLARGVNIPLLPAGMSDAGASHAGVVFRFQRSGTRILQHADDMYAVRMAPFFPVAADGARLPEAEHARAYYEALWTPFAEMSRYGWTHAPVYDVGPPWSDHPHSRAACGSWASASQSGGYALDKRYLAGTWDNYLSLHCSGVLTEAELTRLHMPPARPVEELRRRAATIVSAWGGCSSVQATIPSWEPSRGTDTWSDS